MNFELANFVAITALAYWFGEAIKASTIDNKYIPPMVGLFGIVLGIAAYNMQIPNYPAEDIITAAAVGFGSAMAATGLNQIYKQLSTNCKSGDGNTTESDKK